MSILQRREHICLTRELEEAIECIALHKHPKIVGSFSYIAHPYPGDIDMFEEYEEQTADVNKAAMNIQKKFQAMAQRIKSRKNTYLSDFKAGEDKRFRCDFYGSKKQLEEYIDHLVENKWLTRTEANLWRHALRESREQFIEYVRSKLVIRWTLREIETGTKHLGAGIWISLAEALTQQTVVKVDLISLVNGYYTEITNLFKLTCRDPLSRKTVYLSQPDMDYETSLLKDLKKYIIPTMEKYLKLAKRYWSYCMFKHKQNQLEQLRPLLESGAARLGQIVSLIEIIMILYNKLGIFPKTSLRQIQQLNFAIGSVSQSILKASESNLICANIRSIHEHSSKQYVLHILIDIQNILRRVINRYAAKYLKQKNILSEIEALLSI